MENIIFNVLWRLTTSWNNLTSSVEGMVSRRLANPAKLLEGAIAVSLWCVPLVFWTVVIRFVVKHW